MALSSCWNFDVGKDHCIYLVKAGERLRVEGTFKRPFVGPVIDVRFSFKNGKHYLVVSVCAPLAHINTCIEFDFRYSLNLSKCACSITDN